MTLTRIDEITMKNIPEICFLDEVHDALIPYYGSDKINDMSRHCSYIHAYYSYKELEAIADVLKLLNYNIEEVPLPNHIEHTAVICFYNEFDIVELDNEKNMLIINYKGITYKCRLWFFRNKCFWVARPEDSKSNDYVDYDYLEFDWADDFLDIE